MRWIVNNVWTWKDAKRVDALGTTLERLKLINIFDVVWNEFEKLEDGCRCGSCFDTPERWIDIEVYSNYEDIHDVDVGEVV